MFEPLAGEQSAIETRSAGMPGETVEVGHIVVVDDDAMVLQTITNYLEEHNVPVASVPCRQDLNRHLEKAHPSQALPKFESYRCSRNSPNFLTKVSNAYEQFHGIGRLA